MVGRPVRVASCELAVADVRWDHELLGDHDVHRDEVALEGFHAAGFFVAPVILEVEQGLRLNITVKISPQCCQMWIPGRWGPPSKPQSTPSQQHTRHK